MVFINDYNSFHVRLLHSGFITLSFLFSEPVCVYFAHPAQQFNWDLNDPTLCGAESVSFQCRQLNNTRCVVDSELRS